MIVADTNLLIHLYVQGERTAESEAMLRRDAVWNAPLLWRSEFRNVLIGLARRDAIHFEDALAMVGEAERWLVGREYSVISRQVLTLALQSGCSASDCEFVALLRISRSRSSPMTGPSSRHSLVWPSRHRNLPDSPRRRPEARLRGER